MEKHKGNNPPKSGVALLPFVIFIGLYLGAGIYLSIKKVDMAFYQFPVLVACFVGLIFAFILHKGKIAEKFDYFIAGMGNADIMTMCMIYLLAGAFSSATGAMGGVESTVNLALNFIPPSLLIAGIFIVSAFLSLAMGTSMGTISAVGPIAVPLAIAANLNLPLTVGAFVGGAMFGDNLSIISDTTIAATKSQHVEMKDKFNLNLKMALPAAIITVVLLLIFGRPDVPPETAHKAFDIIKVLPYIFVLVFALIGFNVFAVLAGGIIFSVIIGLATGSFGVLEAAQAMNSGMMGMFEIFVLSMLVGGLANMVTKAGGIQWLLDGISKGIKSRTSAELGIAGLVSAVDCACANNTVAIIISGPIAKELSNRYKVDPRRAASLLDSFSCVFQGLIPYGAQMLLAVKLTEGAVSPFEIIPNVWYVFILMIVAILSTFIPFTDGALRKDPWNYEWDCRESEVEQMKKIKAEEAANA